MDSADLRQLFLKDGFILPKTSGKSMRPLVWGEQHRVVVVPLKGKPEIGDILMFSQSLPGRKEKNVIHRLVEIRDVDGKPVYITRGDNCLGCESVSRDEIIGRVEEIHRISGYRPWHIIAKRQFSVADPSYLRYVRFWTGIWRVRRVYYILRAYSHALFAKLKFFSHSK